MQPAHNEYSFGNTVTVEKTKTVNELFFQFVSVSPTKKPLIEKEVLQHIKDNQSAESNSWAGMQVQFISRPGISNMATNPKLAKLSEYLKVKENLSNDSDRIKPF